MSDSSDSDLEEKAKFEAAAVGLNEIPCFSAKEVKPLEGTSSLRHGFQKGIKLDTTAEFRSFIAKKLFDSLERRIKYKKFKGDAECNMTNTPEEDWGFPLFSTSLTNSKSEEIKLPVAKRRRRSNNKPDAETSSDSDSAEKLSTVAVDVQTILADKSLLNTYRVKEKHKDGSS